jgi:hypothetical protein
MREERCPSQVLTPMVNLQPEEMGRRQRLRSTLRVLALLTWDKLRNLVAKMLRSARMVRWTRKWLTDLNMGGKKVIMRMRQQ